jgi:ATP-dependent 26S proteasome regulatory subunit
MAAADPAQEIELLLRSNQALIQLNTPDDQRVQALLDPLAAKHDLGLLAWSPARGFSAKPVNVRGAIKFQAPQGTDPVKALMAIYEQDLEILFYFHDFQSFLQDPKVIDLLKKISRRYSKHAGALIFNSGAFDPPAALRPLFAPLEVPGPGPEEIEALIASVLLEVGKRQPVKNELDAAQTRAVVNALAGLSQQEVEKVLTRVMVRDGRLSADDLGSILEAKKSAIERDGVLEYFAADAVLGDIAGLARLKDWLRERKAVFLDPALSKKNKLPFPKGILLLGVQGCGKSFCAKAVAKEWELPLLKLDPSNLYSKYIGDSEQNLKSAMRTSEAMAPLVLWIDEIEKAFSGAGDSSSDGGLSRRIFGTFISWMQEKTAPIFIVATSNDVTQLPPELLRKGRFDEIFFVDLPDVAARKEIWKIHLAKRDLDPAAFDLKELAKRSDGFSGAEIEQAVIAGVYSAVSGKKKTSTESLETELSQTKPLSVTMAEKVTALRVWAKDRTTPAD